MSLQIEPFYEPGSGTWTYLIHDSISKAAAIIDPVWVYDPVSGEADDSCFNKVLGRAAEKQLRIEWILETHAHADHLTGAGEIRRRTGARLACGKGICSVQKVFAAAFNLDDVATDGSQFDRLLREGESIQLGELEIHVIETPGHTSDSITYLVEDAAFIGDTLFSPGYGSARCDFPGGDAGQLFDSIQRLYRLPPDTRLFLCHDYPDEGQEPICQVSVSESSQKNIHVKSGTRREDFVAMREARDAKLSLPRLILPSLQINIRAGQAPPPETNGAGYLKTPFNRSMDELIHPKQS